MAASVVPLYKRRPLSIIFLGFGRRTTCVNKQPPATPAHLHRECPTDITLRVLRLGRATAKLVWHIPI